MKFSLKNIDVRAAVPKGNYFRVVLHPIVLPSVRSCTHIVAFKVGTDEQGPRENNLGVKIEGIFFRLGS